MIKLTNPFCENKQKGFFNEKHFIFFNFED